MSRRRRSASNALVVIFWRDIPAQITASVGGKRHKALLDARFQHAIDRAAANAGLTDDEAYVGEWHRVNRATIDDPTPPDVEAEAALIEASYSPARLEALVAAGGLDSDPTSFQAPTVGTTSGNESSRSESFQ